MRRQLPTLPAALGAAAAIAVGACPDVPTRPGDADAAHARFAVAPERRGELRPSLLFVIGEPMMSALARRRPADEIALAFRNLAQRFDADDRIGAARRTADAHDAIQRYQELGDDEAALELEPKWGGVW